MEYYCKWGGAKSPSFEVQCGSKQGGILSPDFFSVYINDLVLELENLGIGCHLAKTFVACILFADDMALAAPSRACLQKMIDVVAAYCRKFCLNINVKKTKTIVFGPAFRKIDGFKKLYIHGQSIEFVQEWRYLGFYLRSGPTVSFSAEHDLRSFHRACNSILNVLSGADEVIQMKLLFSNCIPIITYGCSIKEFSASEMSQCNVSINNAIRKIFTFRRSESVRELRKLFGYPSVYDTFREAKSKLLMKMQTSNNSILKKLSTVPN